MENDQQWQEFWDLFPLFFKNRNVNCKDIKANNKEGRYAVLSDQIGIPDIWSSNKSNEEVVSCGYFTTPHFRTNYLFKTSHPIKKRENCT